MESATPRQQPGPATPWLETDGHWLAELERWRSVLGAVLSVIVLVDDACMPIVCVGESGVDAIVKQGRALKCVRACGGAESAHGIHALSLAAGAQDASDPLIHLGRARSASRLTLVPLAGTQAAKAWWVLGYAGAGSPLTELQMGLMQHAAEGWRAFIDEARESGRRNAGLLSDALDAVGVPCFVSSVFGEVLAVGFRAGELIGESRLAETDCVAMLGRAATECWGATSGYPSAPVPLYDDTLQLVFTELRHGDGCWTGRQLVGLLRSTVLPEPVFGSVLSPLTLAEQAVTRELVRGRRLSEVASLRKVSIETVRSQAKTIYSKLGVRNHIDLLALVQKRASSVMAIGAQVRASMRAG